MEDRVELSRGRGFHLKRLLGHGSGDLRRLGGHECDEDDGVQRRGNDDGRGALADLARA